MRVIPKLQKQLSITQLEQLHACALELCKNFGVKIHSDALRARFQGRDGVEVRGESVCFAPWLINRYLEEQRNLQTVSETKNSITVSPYDYASNIVDMDSGIIRPITSNDLIEITKLVHSLNVAGYPIIGGCPGFAQDLPEQMRSLFQYKTAIEFSSNGYEYDAPTIRVQEYISRMSVAAGKMQMTHKSSPETPYLNKMAEAANIGTHIGLYMFNPLRVDESSLQRAVHFIDLGLAAGLSVTTMPLFGATTPIHLSLALSQSMAECLGGMALLKLLTGKPFVSFCVALFSFDMLYANISLGSAEEAIFAVLCREINEYYGVDTANRYIFSSAKQHNAQSASEKTMGMLYKALAGVSHFTVAGATASTVFSIEQLVIDCEIARMVNRLLQGVDIDDPSAHLSIMRDCYESGQFLDHDSTLEGFRDVYFMPQLFSHDAYKQRPDLLPGSLAEQARSTAKAMIASHNYSVDVDIFKKLEEIYAEAEKELTAK